MGKFGEVSVTELTAADGTATWSWLMTPEKSALSDEQENQLDAIFNGILPGDHARGVPRASDVGAARFVGLLLARDTSVYYEIGDWQRLYPAWLSSLDAYAVAKYGRSLTAAAASEIDEIIAGLEANSLINMQPPIDQKLAFKTFLRHCIQGCFADPRWGGNRDRIMWRWIGYLQQPETIQ